MLTLMKSPRGIAIFFGSAACWGCAAWLLRSHLPDTETAFFVYLTGTVTSGLILGTVWRVDEPEATRVQIALIGALIGLLTLHSMWTPLPAEQDFPRLMSLLPWRFVGDKAFGTLLAVAFVIWTVLASYAFEGFERRFWLAIGFNNAGLAVLDTYFFGHIHPVWPVGLLLAVLGFFGPELSRLTRRRPRNVFGSARFEDDQGAAKRAGLQ